MTKKNILKEYELLLQRLNWYCNFAHCKGLLRLFPDYIIYKNLAYWARKDVEAFEDKYTKEIVEALNEKR
jgi:hypothetical protein